MAISPANQRQHKLDLAFQARSVSEEEKQNRSRSDKLFVLVFDTDASSIRRHAQSKVCYTALSSKEVLIDAQRQLA